MPADVEINIGRALKQLTSAKAAVRRGVERGMKDTGAILVREAKQRAPRKTRTLSRSIKAKFVKSPDGDTYGLEYGIGTAVGGEPLVYARIQDLGGVVTAKRAKKLAIPVHPALRTRKAGVSGVTARMVIADPKQFGFASTFTTEKAILGRKLGVKGKKAYEVLFARKESVKIDRTGYLSDPYYQATTGEGLLNVVRDRVEKQLAALRGK